MNDAELTGTSACGAVPPEVFEEIYRRHGHRCPMSTLGGRIGWAARPFVGQGVEALYCIRTCAVDGIRTASGCEPTVVERGMHRLVLLGESDGLSIALTRQALDTAWEYRRANEALERERPGLDAEQLGLREQDLGKVLQQVLERLWSLEEGVLLEIAPLSADEYQTLKGLS